MQSRNSKVTIVLLLSNVFVAFVGIGLVIPVLPTIMNEMNINGAVVGNMVAAFAIAQLIASPFTGKWTDRIGRKPMILLGLLIFSLSELLFGIGQTVELLFISRTLGGISSALIMPAVTAFIADITSEYTRPKILGYMSAAINSGFIIGPGIGGLLAGLGTRAPFFAASVLAAIAFIISFFLLKEPEQLQAEQTDGEKKVGPKQIFAQLYFIPLLLLFTSTFGLAAFESLFSLFVDHKFHFTPFDIAIIVTGGGLVGAIAQVLFFDRLARKLGEIILVRYCFILSAFLVYVMTFVESYFAVVITSCILFVGFDLIIPAITSYLSKNAAGNEQGFVGGMNSAFTSLGNIFGPIVGGILFDINIHYPYLFATAVMILSIAITFVWKKPCNIVKN